MLEALGWAGRRCGGFFFGGTGGLGAGGRRIAAGHRGRVCGASGAWLLSVDAPFRPRADLRYVSWVAARAVGGSAVGASGPAGWCGVPR